MTKWRCDKENKCSFLHVMEIDASILTHGDILLSIFGYLAEEDIGKCAQVCKFWSYTATSPKLWVGIRGCKNRIC